jgi:hypothetical protein
MCLTSKEEAKARFGLQSHWMDGNVVRSTPLYVVLTIVLVFHQDFINCVLMFFVIKIVNNFLRLLLVFNFEM